jgi:hypothetical protein
MPATRPAAVTSTQQVLGSKDPVAVFHIEIFAFDQLWMFIVHDLATN